jgi:hypothetical protein
MAIALADEQARFEAISTTLDYCRLYLAGNLGRWLKSAIFRLASGAVAWLSTTY